MKTLAAFLVLAFGLLGSLSGCRATGAAQSTCTVEGCVERSGPIELSGDATAFEVVMRAGPIAGRSDLSRVQLLRRTPPGEVSMVLNLGQMLEQGDSTFNVLVQPGDVLTVPELAR